MSVKNPAPMPPQGAKATEEAEAQSTRRLDRVAGWVLVALALALYLRTGARDLLPGDPGEFQVAAWKFGLAHATGYPLYLLTGGIWQRLLGLGGISPAYALNVLSAFTAAAAVGVLYMGALRAMPGTVGVRRWAAILGGAWLVTMPTFWSQALIAEVYALHGLFIALLIWFVAGWDAQQDDAGERIPLVPLALVTGLSLTHHAITLLLLPGLAVALWRVRRTLPTDARIWLMAAVAMAAPLLLYLYIPLRATPQASPWYFPLLGTERLALYGGGIGGFFDFVSGRSISVGFHGIGEAIAQLGTAWQLWRIHLGWPGLVLAAIGLYAMAGAGQRPLLVFTGLSAILIQIFNLFYAIGDILVYYIPLYIFAAIWIGFGAAQLARGIAAMIDGNANAPGTIGMRADGGAAARQGIEALALLLVIALLFFPLRQWTTYQSALDQTNANGARRLWESVLAANPAPDTVLVSNDRNEIVPLYYLQAVEGRRPDLAGIFPLLTPESRFADIGATVETALAARPSGGVLLIKPMPGLEVKFALEPAGEPLMRVQGLAAQRAPTIALGQPYGPLLLTGIDWEEVPAADNQQPTAITLRLYWLVQSAVPGDFTTTTQLFDASGSRVAQHDAMPGGVYYPTSLWKPGETLVEEHPLSLPADATATSLLVGMYAGADMATLAAPLNLAIDGLRP